MDFQKKYWISVKANWKLILCIVDYSNKNCRNMCATLYFLRESKMKNDSLPKKVVLIKKMSVLCYHVHLRVSFQQLVSTFVLQNWYLLGLLLISGCREAGLRQNSMKKSILPNKWACKVVETLQFRDLTHCCKVFRVPAGL